MYGRRARLGVLVPSQIVAIELEFGLVTPAGTNDRIAGYGRLLSDY